MLHTLLDALRSRGAAVLVAETGAGKTTRVPPALLELDVAGEIIVCEPRRLAARLAAERVARERGEDIGDSIGYTVRFDDRRGPRTRVRFVTTGVLLRRLAKDPQLVGCGAVIFDELHERHVADDVLLAWVRRLRATTRPELMVVAMSATLDPAPVADFLDASIVRSSGRAFPVEVAYLPREDTRELPVAVAASVARVTREGRRDGDTLVFLPGVRELERCAQACGRVAAESGRLELVTLHGGLTPEETRAALRPPADGHAKILFATNVAESSITLPRVTTVIDSGLHNVARSSPWSGLASLSCEEIPRDSADQRAGRAGRTAPGSCLRLYTEASYRRRAPRLAPEIRRSDLAPIALLLAALEVGRAQDLDWLDAPEAARWAAATTLLAQLGALSLSLSLSNTALTDTGRRMLDLPLHPRLGRLLLAARAEGAARSGATCAALLSEGVRLPSGLPASASDVLALAEAFDRRRLPRSVGARVARVARQLGGGRDRSDDVDTAILRAVLSGYPDRVGVIRGGKDVLLAGGGTARLGRDSTVRSEPWIVCVEAGGSGTPVARQLSGIEPDWLLELPCAEDALTEQLDVRWLKDEQRVVARRTIRWQGLVMEETAADARGLPESTELLRRKARAAGLARFADVTAVTSFSDRRRFAHALEPDIPTCDAEAVLETLDALCEGRESFKQVEAADLMGALRGQLTWKQRRRLDELAPVRVELPGGGSANVDYSGEGKPRVQVRLQRLLGSREGPLLGQGRVRPLLELLAPNGRAVQLTDDLAGFWERTWPDVRKELRGRYPKHDWPEDPIDGPRRRRPRRRS